MTNELNQKGDKYEKTLEDELDWNSISQLHAATLNISSQSFEIKKICVTIEVAALTFIAKLAGDKVDASLFAAGLVIPLMFYFVDCVTYYYQDKLRGVMIIKENTIRVRNGLNELVNNHKDPGRILKTLFNNSHWMYLALIILDLIIFIIYKCGTFN